MGVERTLLFFGVLLTTSALVFAIFSRYWAEFTYNKKPYNAGLWAVCSQEEDSCLSYDEWLDDEDTPTWIVQIRTLIIISGTLCGFALLTSVSGVLQKRIKCVFTSVLQFFCAVLLAGACAIFAEKKYFHNERMLISVKHHWGFYLTIATAGWALLVTVFGIFADYCLCFKERTTEADYAFYANV